MLVDMKSRESFIQQFLDWGIPLHETIDSGPNISPVYDLKTWIQYQLYKRIYLNIRRSVDQKQHRLLVVDISRHYGEVECFRHLGSENLTQPQLTMLLLKWKWHEFN